jgi:hypothetical protein
LPALELVALSFSLFQLSKHGRRASFLLEKCAARVFLRLARGFSPF